MHADLIWLAENVSEWGSNLHFSHIVKVGEKHDYVSGHNVDPDGIYRSRGHSIYRAFTRAQWQAARDELVNPFLGGDSPCMKAQARQWQAAKDSRKIDHATCSIEDPFSSPEEDEAWQAAEDRMDIIGHNGATGEHYKSIAQIMEPDWKAISIAADKRNADKRNADKGKQPRYQDAQGEDWIDEAARTFTAEEFRGAMRFSIGKYNRRMGKKDELIKEIEKMRNYCSRWLEVELGR